MKKPEVEKEVTVIEHLSSRVRQLESERREHLELIKAISKCGSPQTMNVLIEKAQQALHNAGVEE